MRVLFIVKESIMRERLGIMYLSSALKRHGHEVRLVLFDRLGIKGLDRIMTSYSPAIIGYSLVTGEHVNLLKINRLLKKDYKFISVFGGPHATFSPELIKEDGCDAVCVGEGDIAFPEFCRRVECNEAYWETPNFTIKHKGEIIRNPILPLVENLDELPYPDRTLMYEADPDLLDVTNKIFFSSRGCPYKCTYCFNKKYNEIYKGKGQIPRYRSPESLISEICSVKERHLLNIVWIDDDIFLLKPKGWLRGFANLYKERVKLPFSCNVRANLVTEENIYLLKNAGLDSVCMGIECGNEEIANNVLERGLNNEQIITASRIIQNYNIKLYTENILGLPIRNSYQADLQTLDLNIRIKPTYASTQILFPYPGTPITSYAKDHGFLPAKMPVFETYKRSSSLNFSKREKRKIENLQKLFDLIVSFTFLRNLCNLLCVLPLKSLYTGLYYSWYGYNIKMKIFPFHSITRELGKYIRLWWKFTRKN